MTGVNTVARGLVTEFSVEGVRGPGSLGLGAFSHFTVPSMGQTLIRRLFGRSRSRVLEDAETQAARGNADAQFHLGLKYANGKKLSHDYGRAAEWYLKAAEQNHSLAQFNLGTMHASGQGVPQNETEAETWFGKAAQLGDAGAQHQLGLSRYRDSLRGGPQALPESRIEAYKWFALAAMQGYRGSGTARDTVVLNMTPEDVAEALQRAERFMLSIRGILACS